MARKSIYTLAVHAGEDLTRHFGSVSVPIYNASVFSFSDADEGSAIHNYEKPGYFYGKLGNPTQDSFEKAICELENGEAALGFASGMAAVSASILTIIKSGDHIIAPDSMYSTTTFFLEEIAEKFGVELTFVDATNAASYANACKNNTKLFWIESPSNPLLKITDIVAVTEIAKSKGIITVADNTFATPFNQKPIDFGVDIVVHSATKYLGGHSDLTAGVMVGKREIVEKARLRTTKLYGGNIAPQVAWLVLRGIKTLALRMERHNSNASVIANMLTKHPKIISTYYPEFDEVARKQMRGFSGMIAFDVGSVENGKKLVNNLKICTLATSLGGVETIIQHSASMTHAALPLEQRLKAGVTDGLIRLSVGIEDITDLIEDLQQALGNI
jgi:methionine-gamma-lyase